MVTGWEVKRFSARLHVLGTTQVSFSHDLVSRLDILNMVKFTVASFAVVF